MIKPLVLAAFLAVGLSACGEVVPPASTPAPPVGPTAGSFGKPRELIGMDARRLTQMFGTPRLDIRDRTVRKLQFANGRCVLDAYLYSSAKGKEPLVTHIDSRLPNGTDTDPVACATALRLK